MSWFFGKKKHRDSLPDTPEEQGQQPDEEFIFVEKKNQPTPNSDDQPSGLYPSLNNIALPYPPPLPGTSVKQGSLDNQSNYMSSISFKLNHLLERYMNDDLVIDQLRLDEIASFIKRINVDNYDYTFSLERSVISELDSQKEE